MTRGTPLERLVAAIFDMDGVLVETSSAHAASWKAVFDAFLASRAAISGRRLLPMDEREDYLEFLDGRTRYEGARAFLEGRKEDVSFGDPGDEPGRPTVCGLANLKDLLFLECVRREGVKVFESSVALVRRLAEREVRLAVVTGSRHADELLEAAGIRGLFEVKIGGGEASDLGLPGKPDPATLLEAARRLETDPWDTAVIEDSLSGIEAARRGGFGVVVGVDRVGNAPGLRRAGADVVVKDLAELLRDGVEMGTPLLARRDAKLTHLS